MAIDISQPNIDIVPCIEVEWNGSTLRYCRAEQDITFDGNLYTAMPTLDFELDFSSGGIEDKPQYILVDLDADPFDKMLLHSFAPVTITVLEADYNDQAETPSPVYLGEVAITKARFNDNSRSMRLECWGRKAELKGVSLGIKATDRCPWAFGQHPCGASPASVSAEVASIDGTVVTFVSLPNDNDQGAWTAGRYTRGFVEFEGLRIMIRKHLEGSAKVVLAKSPPQSTGNTWVGETISVTEGCDKGLTACTAWGQEASFGGVGRAMPAYNPILEDKAV